jgi:hypothetical protein
MKKINKCNKGETNSSGCGCGCGTILAVIIGIWLAKLLGII